MAASLCWQTENGVTWVGEKRHLATVITHGFICVRLCLCDAKIEVWLTGAHFTVFGYSLVSHNIYWERYSFSSKFPFIISNPCLCETYKVVLNLRFRHRRHAVSHFSVRISVKVEGKRSIKEALEETDLAHLTRWGRTTVQWQWMFLTSGNKEPQEFRGECRSHFLEAEHEMGILGQVSYWGCSLKETCPEVREATWCRGRSFKQRCGFRGSLTSSWSQGEWWSMHGTTELCHLKASDSHWPEVRSQTFLYKAAPTDKWQFSREG